MLFIPAIDLRRGRCVRLSQGREDKEKVYYENPLEAAKWLLGLGVKTVHVVDLDGAIKGNQENRSIVEKLLSMGLEVELGGGIRDYASGSTWLNMGVSRIIVSTMFYENPGEFMKLASSFPERVWLGLDVSDGKLAVKGWKELTEITPEEASKRAIDLGAGGIIYTDIKRDGMESGPDFEGGKSIMEATDAPVILSGGVKSIDDIRKAKELGFFGIISGRAVYERRFSVEEALKLAEDA